MNVPKKPIPRIAAVEAGTAPLALRVQWSHGGESLIDLSGPIDAFRVYAPLRDAPERFPHVRVGEFGTDIVWDDQIDMAADMLWALAQEQSSEVRAL